MPPTKKKTPKQFMGIYIYISHVEPYNIKQIKRKLSKILKGYLVSHLNSVLYSIVPLYFQLAAHMAVMPGERFLVS